MKAPHITIGAFATAKQNDRSETLMIGDGELLDACKALVAELNIVESVTFWAPEPKAVVEIMAVPMCLCSTRWTQLQAIRKAPLAILEVGACGLLRDCHTPRGIPDVISDGINGFWLNRAMKRRWQKNGGVGHECCSGWKMGREARRRIESGYTGAKYLEGYGPWLKQAWTGNGFKIKVEPVLGYDAAQGLQRRARPPDNWWAEVLQRCKDPQALAWDGAAGNHGRRQTTREVESPVPQQRTILWQLRHARKRKNKARSNSA